MAEYAPNPYHEMPQWATPPYEIRYPSGGVGFSYDLEQIGIMYLAVNGNAEIYDRLRNRVIDPEVEIRCVAIEYDGWIRDQQAERRWRIAAHRAYGSAGLCEGMGV